MQWPKLFAFLFLLLLAIVLAIGNVWIAAVRSTIPLELAEQRIVKKEVRGEKHPGRDDVHFLTFDSGLKLHVDSSVYYAVDVDGLLRKDAWSRELNHKDSVIQLTFSRDFQGMVRLMPAVIGVIAFTAVFVMVSSRASYDKSITSAA